MSMNYASAEIMNNLVLALAKTEETIDYALSIQENALSYNSVTRNLQLLYGLSSIKSSSFSMIDEVLVLGKGLVKTSLETLNIELPSASNELGFSVTDIFGGLDTMSDGFVVGAIYLTSDAGDNEEIAFTLARPKAEPLGVPIVFSKDVTLETMQELVQYTNELTYPAPSKDYYVEIYKFIADVSYYDQTIKNSRAFFNLVDERKPRGYFGYSDEKLSKIIVPQVISNYALISELYNTQKNLVTQIINSWAGSSVWTPSFVDFWNNSSKSLPSDLESFLDNELGIKL